MAAFSGRKDLHQVRDGCTHLEERRGGVKRTKPALPRGVEEPPLRSSEKSLQKRWRRLGKEGEKVGEGTH